MKVPKERAPVTPVVLGFAKATYNARVGKDRTVPRTKLPKRRAECLGHPSCVVSRQAIVASGAISRRDVRKVTEHTKALGDDVDRAKYANLGEVC